MKHLITLLLIITFLPPCFAQDARGAIPSGTSEASVTGNTYAIIVGVSNYTGLPPLRFADKDALLFEEFLKSPAGGYVKDENIYTLINEKATANAFNVDACEWLDDKKLQKGDRLYLYFAGHADAINEDNYFLLPYDCHPNGDENNYMATGRIEMHYVKTRLIKPYALKGVQVFLIVDACRSKDLPGPEHGFNFQQSIAEQREADPDHDIIMLSCESNQVSFETPEVGYGHGLFTWYLVDALNGAAAHKNGIILLRDVNRYVTGKVADMADSLFRKRQNPVFFGDGDLRVATFNKVAYTAWEAETTQPSYAANYDLKRAGIFDVRGGMDIGTSDTTDIALFNKFINAINEDNFIGEHSAYVWFKEMKDHNADEKLIKKAKYELATGILNFAQEKINRFLQGQDQYYKIFNKQVAHAQKDSSAIAKVCTLPYSTAAEMVDTALSLLKHDRELRKAWYPKLLFFKALMCSTEGNETQFHVGLTYINEAIARIPNAAYCYMIKGWLMDDMGYYDSAIYYQTRAVQLAPHWAYPYNSLGNAYLDNDNGRDALHYYKKAIALDSIYRTPLTNAANVYYLEGEYDSAIHYINKAIVVDTQYSRPYNLLGKIYLKKARKDSIYLARAHAAFAKAISFDYSFTDAYVNLAKLYAKENKADSAIYVLIQGIGRDRLNTALYTALANLYKGRNDVYSSYYWLNMAKKADEKNTQVSLEWAEYLYNSGDEKRARKEIEKACANSNCAATLCNAGQVLFSHADFSGAQKFIHNSISADSAYLRAYVALSSLYLARGNNDMAIMNLQRAFESGYVNYDYLESMPEMNVLQQDERFKELLKKYFPDQYKE
jgi:lipopolysaccharide biosynthesis regulator YciM